MRGTGSIYKRSTDSRWVGVVPVPRQPGEPRQRKTVTAAFFCLALRKMSEAHPYDPDLPARRGRSGHMAQARALGTHKAWDWGAYCRSLDWTCEYCGRKCEHWEATKDHRVPVARGGSDALDNLALACGACNQRKRDTSEEEFRWRLENEPALREAVKTQPRRRGQGIDTTKIRWDLLGQPWRTR